LKVLISPNKDEMGRQAAAEGAVLIREAIASQGSATIIVATGASQFEMLSALIEEADLDWSKVTGFHLDEYTGMSIDHPASFRKYLKERFVDKINIGKFNYDNGEGLDGNGDVAAECERLDELISAQTVDVAFVGIGENGHLAFNDPPADFETEKPYLIVDLDEACRQQQLGEGWFPTLDDVPKKAVSMSVRQIMKSKHIVCTVPDERKAKAVQGTVEGPVSNQVPAAIMQQHESMKLYLDQPAASLLKK